MLSEINPHPLDSRVQFFEEGHRYVFTPMGNRVRKSVTGLLKPFFDTFDGAAIVARQFEKWLRDEDGKYGPLCQYLTLVLGLSAADAQLEVLKLWAAKGEVACAAGTQMHQNIEDFLNGVSTVPVAPSDPAPALPEGVGEYLAMMQSFYPDMELKPWRTEFLVLLTTRASDGVEIPVVAGAIDCLMVDKTGRYWILDWKRVNPDKKGLLGKRKSNGFRQDRAKGPFCEHDADSFTQYSAQLLAYKWIIEHGGYDMKIAGCFLVQIHPKLGRAHVVEVADLDDEIDEVMRSEVELARREREDALAADAPAESQEVA